MIVQAGDGIFIADGQAELDEVAEAIGVDLAAGEQRRGYRHDRRPDRQPLAAACRSRGEVVAGPDGFEFEVLDADPRRVKRVRIHRRGRRRRVAGASSRRRARARPSDAA